MNGKTVTKLAKDEPKIKVHVTCKLKVNFQKQWIKQFLSGKVSRAGITNYLAYDQEFYIWLDI